MIDMHMMNAMREMLYYAMVGVCIITIPILVVGLIMSVIQSATQINEMTLTFIPKFLVMFILLFMFSPWLMEKLILITQHFFKNLPAYIR